MTLYYPIQNKIPLVGTTTASTLTAAYSGNTASVACGGMYKAQIYMTYTPAADSRILYWQIEESPDRTGTDFYYMLDSDLSSGAETCTIVTTQFTGTTGSVSYKITYEKEISSRQIRISFKESGSSNFGTIVAYLLLSGK